MKLMKTPVIAVLMGIIACGLCSCAPDESEKSPPGGIKIATLAPHLAEIAYSLGLTENIVAVGRYCRVDDSIKGVPAVSDALGVNSEALAASGADFVFHNSRAEFFTPLKKIRPDVQVFKLANANLDELFSSILKMGEVCDKSSESKALVDGIQAKLAEIKTRFQGQNRPRVMYIEGFAPMATVGSGFVTHELIEIAGGENVAASGGFSGWVSMNVETIAKLNPQILICHVRPGPDGRAEMEKLAKTLREITGSDDMAFYATDDRSLSIPGPNIARTAGIFAEMIHGEKIEPAADKKSAGEK